MSSSSSASSGSADDSTLRCDGLGAQVLNGSGNPMPFYGVRREGRLVEAYTEAKEGEKFAVKIDSPVLDGTYIARLEIGGQLVREVVCKSQSEPVTIQHRQISETEAETLKFAKVVATGEYPDYPHSELRWSDRKSSLPADDEVQGVRDLAEVDRMCQIHIIVNKEVRKGQSHQASFSKNDLVPKKEVYEKAKKVGAVQFSAGPIVASKAPPRYYKPIYDSAFPRVEFKIRCITRVGLQLRKFIPFEKEEKKKRPKEAEGVDALEKYLENELDRVKKRKRALEDAESSGSSGAQGRSNVKVEPVAFDFSRGGTAENPLDIDDSSEE
ncbi:hypothetical protein A4X13_0g3731 [Tilletia indica]|uniref:Uncharacterized protein n=1 Tax=Tilletia indica TaxID=43049 RepID=A0A177TBK4_9BASI|nr:hypothetical protein A4X13_0g3731 [Tilletia indica]